jgi:hypothetical protein
MIGAGRAPRRRRRGAPALVALVWLVVLGAVAAAPAPAATRAAATFKPAADAYVSSARRHASFGRAESLKAGRSPVTRSYLRFRIKGLRGRVARATLVLYVRRAGGRLVARRARGKRWSERRLTFSAAPRLGARAGKGRPSSAGAWVAIDVTRLVPRRGSVTITVVAGGRRAVAVSSREAGRALAPRLLVEARKAGDPRAAAAGNIACDPSDPDFQGGAGTGETCAARSTSDLLVGRQHDAVLTLGDAQYECGGMQAYLQSYGPTWGRVKAITHPAIGNHDVVTNVGTDCDTSGGGGGYFRYFGAAAGTPGRGYYSFDLGAWHLVSLDSNCDSVGCGPGSPQQAWLRADLAAHPAACTLAFFHEPRFASVSGTETSHFGGHPSLDALWRALAAAHADVALTAHNHAYERFAPQDPDARADPLGIREFVVGTGGRSHHPFFDTAANSVVRDAGTFGVVELRLRATRYSWRFVPAAGAFTDAGSGDCH